MTLRCYFTLCYGNNIFQNSMLSFLVDKTYIIMLLPFCSTMTKNALFIVRQHALLY